MPLSNEDRKFLVHVLHTSPLDQPTLTGEAAKAVEAECRRLRLIAEASVKRAAARPALKRRKGK
jgi:hypothetical protein